MGSTKRSVLRQGYALFLLACFLWSLPSPLHTPRLPGNDHSSKSFVQKIICGSVPAPSTKTEAESYSDISHPIHEGLLTRKAISYAAFLTKPALDVLVIHPDLVVVTINAP